MPKTEPVVPFFRTPYNYDRDTASKEHGLTCKDKSLTEQSHAEETDINWIADRYGLGQLDPKLWQQALPNVINPPMTGDFTGKFDFQAEQNRVRQALEAFMLLPAKLRARFDNQPQKLIDFLGDPENREEATFLGLIDKPATPLPGEQPEAPQSAPDKPQGDKKKGKTPSKGSDEPDNP